jgi:hypothetical protein
MPHGVKVNVNFSCARLTETLLNTTSGSIYNPSSALSSSTTQRALGLVVMTLSTSNGTAYLAVNLPAGWTQEAGVRH